MQLKHGRRLPKNYGREKQKKLLQKRKPYKPGLCFIGIENTVRISDCIKLDALIVIFFCFRINAIFLHHQPGLHQGFLSDNNYLNFFQN